MRGLQRILNGSRAYSSEVDLPRRPERTFSTPTPVLYAFSFRSATVGGSVVVVYEGAPDIHPLNSEHHSGILADSQAPQFALLDGSRPFTGSINLPTEATVDGVDISVLAERVAYSKDVDAEAMRNAFNSISWAQFAIHEDFENEAKRGVDSVYPAVISEGKLVHGSSVAGRAFTWTSKVYANITDAWTGYSSGVGAGYLDDVNARWFDDQYVGYTLYDQLGYAFPIESCSASPRRLSVTGTPVAGTYRIAAQNPAYAVGFCTYDDTDGEVKLEATFNGGSNWQTLLDTSLGIDYLGGVVDIAHTGPSYALRLTLTNSDIGLGPTVYRTLICTDPSPWSVA